VSDAGQAYQAHPAEPVDHLEALFMNFWLYRVKLWPLKTTCSPSPGSGHRFNPSAPTGVVASCVRIYRIESTVNR
jgi:hypothetical protein